MTLVQLDDDRWRITCGCGKSYVFAYPEDCETMMRTHRSTEEGPSRCLLGKVTA